MPRPERRTFALPGSPPHEWQLMNPPPGEHTQVLRPGTNMAVPRSLIEEIFVLSVAWVAIVRRALATPKASQTGMAGGRGDEGRGTATLQPIPLDRRRIDSPGMRDPIGGPELPRGREETEASLGKWPCGGRANMIM